MGVSMVSCFFANDTKEYLVVGTAYVREDVRNAYTLGPIGLTLLRCRMKKHCFDLLRCG